MSLDSSDEEKRPTKQIKIDKLKKKSNNNRHKNFVVDNSLESINDSTLPEENNSNLKSKSLKRKLEEQDHPESYSNQTYVKQKSSIGETSSKRANISKVSRLERISEISPKQSINETVSTNIADNTVEPSLYEDAISKPMNSTMIPESTATLDKMMNATVVIEPIKPITDQKTILNETVTVTKSFKKSLTSNSNKVIDNQDEADKTIVSETNEEVVNNTYKAHIDTKLVSTVKVVLGNNKISDLITDDESSPERKSKN